jgi:hypothetical protein
MGILQHLRRCWDNSLLTHESIQSDDRNFIRRTNKPMSGWRFVCLPPGVASIRQHSSTFTNQTSLHQKLRRHSMSYVDVGKENSTSIHLYYEDHGSGHPLRSLGFNVCFVLKDANSNPIFPIAGGMQADKRTQPLLHFP